MSKAVLPASELVDILRASPERLLVATRDVEPELLRRRPSPSEWSTVEVLAHVRACADVRGGAALRIATGDVSSFRAINPQVWITQTNYTDLSFHESLEAFSSQRAELVGVLEQLSSEEWERSVTVTGAGAPQMRSVRFYAQWVAKHELPHLKQVERIVRQLRAS